MKRKKFRKFPLRSLYGNDLKIFLVDILPFLPIKELFQNICILSKTLYKNLKSESYCQVILRRQYQRKFNDNLKDLEDQFLRKFVGTKRPYFYLLVFLTLLVDLEKPYALHRDIVKPLNEFVEEITQKKKSTGGIKKVRRRNWLISQFEDFKVEHLLSEPFRKGFQKSKREVVYDSISGKLFWLQDVRNVEVRVERDLSKIFKVCQIHVFSTYEEEEVFRRSQTGLVGGARTMQTSRKSTGGKAPRKHLAFRSIPAVKIIQTFRNESSSATVSKRVYDTITNLINNSVYYHGQVIDISSVLPLGKKLLLRKRKNGVLRLPFNPNGGGSTSKTKSNEETIGYEEKRGIRKILDEVSKTFNRTHRSVFEDEVRNVFKDRDIWKSL